MSAELWVGPAASGKTTECIRRIQDLKQENPLAAVTVVVPDSRQAAAFRRRLAQKGGAIRVEVGTFGDFYRDILRLSGQQIRLAADTVTLRVLRVCIENTLQTGSIPYYQPIAHTPGFLKALHDRFGELQRANCTPDHFLDHAVGKDPSLAEMALLYCLYRQTMQELGWDDRYSLNLKALDVLRSSPQLISHLALVIVDGFEAFNPSQVEALKCAAAGVELVITLPGSPELHRAVFSRFEESMAMLQASIAGLQLRTVSETTLLPEPLASLEDNLLVRGAPSFPGGSAIRMAEARSVVEEARQALRWIKARHLRDNVQLYDCAVIVPEIGRYRPLLMEAAAEFGIPLRFTQGEDLLHASPIAALLDFLHLAVSGWQRQLVIGSLHSPYLDLSVDGFSPLDADRLEDVSLFGQVVEGFDQWQEALERLAVVEDEKGDQLDRMSLPNLPHGPAARELLFRLESLAERLDSGERRTTTGWVSWLEDLLELYGFFDCCDQGIDLAAGRAFRELLRSLVLAEHVAGSREESCADFLVELHSVLEAADFQEKIDWTQPAVQVLTTLEARGVRFQAAALVGLAEGVFPGVEREDPFFDEETRHALALEPRLERAQEGLFYLALTRSDRFLMLSRPVLAEDGESWEPSPFWESVCGLLQEEPLEMMAGAPLQLTDAASEQEFLFRAVQQRSLPKDYVTKFEARWKALQAASRILAERQAPYPSGKYEGDLALLSSELGELFGPRHIWSASRVEQYARCPFQFFAGSMLGLEVREPPQAGLDAAQLGSMLHVVLEEVYQLAEDPGDPASVLDMLPQAAAQAFESAPDTYGFRPTAYWEIEKKSLSITLVKVVEVLGEQQRAGGWEPLAYEAAFGIRGAPPLQVVSGKDEFLFRGLIDRVDRRAGSEVCVIDYKTGSSHLGKKDLVDGTRLQLPLYALAADQSLGLGRPVEGMYWALLKNEAGKPLLSGFNAEIDGKQYAGLEGAVELAREHIGRIIRSIRQGQFQPESPADGCPSYCPAAGWCWRFQTGRWG